MTKKYKPSKGREYKLIQAFDLRRKQISEAMNLNGMEPYKYHNFLGNVREQISEELFVNGVYRELSSRKNKLIGRQEKRNGSTPRYRW